MLVLARAVTYATLFISLVLVFVPVRVLEWSGAVRPSSSPTIAIVGVLLGLCGAAIALSCVLAFATIGKGTPFPLDPPRRLVVRGPYRYVRNPMYLGAGLALAGAALFYQSLALLVYLAVLGIATHVFIVYYEEPTLNRLFGSSYLAYRANVNRWFPRA